MRSHPKPRLLLVMGRLWRFLRSWRLRWGLVLVLCGVGVLNLLRPFDQGSRVSTRILMVHSSGGSARESALPRLRTPAADGSTRRKVIVLPRLQGHGELTSPPAVNKELSLGVKEDTPRTPTPPTRSTPASQRSSRQGGGRRRTRRTRRRPGRSKRTSR